MFKYLGSRFSKQKDSKRVGDGQGKDL